MLALTPPMGWNSWNTYGAEIHQDLVLETAEAMVRSGLRDAGYTYVVIDDFWEADTRDRAGALVPDPAKFPDGMRRLSDRIHGLGLKFGIYSCIGSFTCGGKPGSQGYEELDAQTFADWGVDFLKYDGCFVPGGISRPTLYRRMGQALRATGRPIVYSVCEGGDFEPWLWAPGAGAHMWRTTGDINDSWESVETIGFGQSGLERHAGPGRWNDPDMLVVGMYGKGNVGHGGCTDPEYRTHFGLWCLLAAPLMIGCDVRAMSDFTRELLTHRGLIAINQDPLGRQGNFVARDWNHYESWAKPLADGSVAVGFFNRDATHTQAIPVAWESLAIHERRVCRVEDVWTGEDYGPFTRQFSVPVGPRDVKMVRLIPLPDPA